MAELLGGGVADSLRHAGFIAMTLTESDAKLTLKAEFPHERPQISEKRQWYFAPQPDQAAFKPLWPEGAIASLSVYRELEGFWHARDELFDEATVAKLSQADTNLGLYFSGRDFATEVLGAIGPRHQFVVARRTFDGNQPAPAIKLPAFAWVLEMKNPREFSPVLLLAYQKIVGLVNIVGGMNGQPQLLLGGEQYHNVEISKATFLVPPNTDARNAAIIYNFAPACAQVGNRFIFSSTLGLTRQLVDELQKPGNVELTDDNTRLELDLKQLAGALDDNRDALITQDMLKQGRSREESGKQIDLVLEGLRRVGIARWRLSAANGQLALEATIDLPVKK